MYFPNNPCSYLLLPFVNAVLCLQVTSCVAIKIDIQSFARFAAVLFWVRRLVEMEWNIIRKFLKVKTENVLNIWSPICFLFSCFHPFCFLSDKCLGIWVFLTLFVFEVPLSDRFRKLCMLWNLIFRNPQCLAGQILLVADNKVIAECWWLLSFKPRWTLIFGQWINLSVAVTSTVNCGYQLQITVSWCWNWDFLPSPLFSKALAALQSAVGHMVWSPCFPGRMGFPTCNPFS